MVSELCYAIHPGAACATKKITPIFKTMAYDPGSTALARRGKFVDSAFKAVEGIDLFTLEYLKIVIISISAVIASFHVFLLCL